MTDTFQNPLSQAQNVRAAALSMAASMTEGRSVKTDDVLDLADYIVGSEPCPLAGLMEPITFDLDLGEVSKDALALFVGALPAPAQPEVITVEDVEGVSSLPLGTVLYYPHLRDRRYFKLGHNDWRVLDSNLLNSFPTRDRNMAHDAMRKLPQVEYIPGGA